MNRKIKPGARITRLHHVLSACLAAAIASMPTGAADQQDGANMPRPNASTMNHYFNVGAPTTPNPADQNRVQRPDSAARGISFGATVNAGSVSPPAAPEPNCGQTESSARADMARVMYPTKLLTADFQAVYDQERSLEKQAQKLSADAADAPHNSMRVGRYGSHIIAFNKCLSDCARYDGIYSTYLDGCAAHFRRYHQRDLEMLMRRSPCGCEALQAMGDEYAGLHHAVLKAHAERLKLLALENTLRSQSGTQTSVTDQSVKAKILPVNESH